METTSNQISSRSYLIVLTSFRESLAAASLRILRARSLDNGIFQRCQPRASSQATIRKFLPPLGANSKVRGGVSKPFSFPLTRAMQLVKAGPNGEKRPRDVIANAVIVAQIAAGEAEEDHVDGRRISGSAGGKARDTTLSPARCPFKPFTAIMRAACGPP